MSWLAGHITELIYFVNFLLILAIVFFERRDTAQTWAWILVITFIPILGFLLYIFFGRGLSRSKIFDMQSIEEIGAEQELKQQKEELLKGTFPVPHTETVDAEQLIYMMTMNDRSIYTTGNSIQLFTDGKEKFDKLIDDILAAKHHIHIEYYIYRSDTLGSRVRDALIIKAMEGIEVRVLVDGWGGSKLKRGFFAPLEEAGGEFEVFFPLFIPYFNPRVNYRNHRKIVVIDGDIGYTGGFNVGDEYLGEVEKFDYWRDNHLRIEGEAVYSLQNRFLMDWNSQHKPEVVYERSYFPWVEAKGSKDIQIVTSGPDSTHEQIKMVYLKMINIAKKEILIQTPYYIPDVSIHEALKLALLSGVNVRIQIPNKPDHILVYWATYSFAAELLSLGAIIETYELGFLHAKTVIIDEEVVSVGSANFDNRSFRLDFEVNTIVYDLPFTKEVRDAFFVDSDNSERLTQEKYNNRGFLIKVKEGIARLISPLL